MSTQRNLRWKAATLAGVCFAVVVSTLGTFGCDGSGRDAEEAKAPAATVEVVDKAAAKAVAEAAPKVRPVGERESRRRVAKAAAAKVRGAKMQPFTGDDDEVELFSSAVTAMSCAMDASIHQELKSLVVCSPLATTTGGFALVDSEQKEVYLLAEGSISRHELEHGFGGAMDITGTVIGERGGIKVIKPDEFTITAKAKPGAFKGCL